MLTLLSKTPGRPKILAPDALRELEPGAGEILVAMGPQA